MLKIDREIGNHVNIQVGALAQVRVLEVRVLSPYHQNISEVYTVTRGLIL